MVKAALRQRLQAINIAPLLRQAIEAAMKAGRHLPLLDGIVKWAATTLEANEHFIRQMVHAKAGKVLRWTGLDENLAEAIIGGLHTLLWEMAESPAHPLRAKAEEGLEKLAAALKFEVAMQTRVAQR